MKMDRFFGKGKEENEGALALVLGLAKDFERVSLPEVMAWATNFSFPREILRVLCGYFEHQRRVQFEGRFAEPLQTITAILPGSKWSSLLLRIVLQDALSEVTKIYPPSSTRTGEKEEMQAEILDYQEEKSFPEKLHEGGVLRSYYERTWYQQELGEFVQ